MRRLTYSRTSRKSSLRLYLIPSRLHPICPVTLNQRQNVIQILVRSQFFLRWQLYFRLSLLYSFFCIQPPFLIPNPTNFLSSSPTFFLTSSFRRSVTLDITWLVMAACSSLLADLTPCCVMKVLRTPVSVFWGYLDTSNADEFEI